MCLKCEKGLLSVDVARGLPGVSIILQGARMARPEGTDRIMSWEQICEPCSTALFERCDLDNCRSPTSKDFRRNTGRLLRRALQCETSWGWRQWREAGAT